MNLASLLELISVDSFEREYLEKKVYILARGNREYYSQLADANTLRSSLLRGGLKASECRLIKEGSDLNPYTYTVGSKKPSYMTEGVDRYVDLLKARALYADGCSLVVYSIDKRFPSFAKLKNSLMADLRARISMNAYASPPNAVGLPVHEDSHDVIILQLDGEKNWEIYDSSTQLPTRSGSAKESDHSHKKIVQAFTLKQGDLAYIPRGIAHRASTSEFSSSIHLTIGVIFTPLAEVLSQVLNELSSQDVKLREAFRSFREPGQESYILEVFKGVLSGPKAVESISQSIDQIERDWIDSACHYDEVGLPKHINSASINPSESRYRVAYPQFIKFEVSDIEAILLYPGNRVAVHPDMVDFIVNILSKAETSFELRDIMTPQAKAAQLELFSFLLKDGFFNVTA